MSGQPEEPNKPVEPESILPIDEHVEEIQEPDGRKVRHRGIYLLPNLFTTANLFTGSFRLAADTLHLHSDFNFTESRVETAPPSLRHSCRSELTRQGISLP